MIRKSIAIAAAIASTATLGASFAASDASARTLPATRVTVKDLPKASDFRFGSDRFVVAKQARGEGQAAISLCQTRTWSQSKPNAVFYGQYRVAGGTSTERGYATIASFASHKAAVAAANQMASGFRTCAARVNRNTNGEANASHQSYRTVKLPGGQVATVVAINWQAAGYSQPMVTETAVVATGTHAELVSIDHGTQAVYGTAEILATVKNSVKTLA